MADRPLRIALISYYLPSGSKIGVGYAVHELASELARLGHDVEVISDCPPVEGANYGHRHVPMTGSLRTFRFALRMRELDFSRYDVVHAAGEDYWLWGLRRRHGVVHIRTLYGSCFEEALHIKGIVGRLRMLLLGLTEVLASVVADETAVISPATRRWTPWVRRVIPVGVDETRFAPGGTRAAHPTVLFVGTWAPRKRGELLARAFVDTVLPALPDAQLWMVSRDVPADAHPSVKALGRVSDEELPELYRQAWVFCLPSSYEGFGIPYVEALASGTPVLATPNHGARYVLDEGRFGDLTDAADLGAALLGLLRDAARREELSELGLRRAPSFDLREVAREYLTLYASHMTRISHK